MRERPAIAFLSLILWPEEMDRVEVVERISASTGVDVPTLRLRLAADAPNIIAALAPDIAESGAQTIRELGGDAFAPTLEDLERLGPTVKIRSLAIQQGQLHAEIWRGPGTTINPDHIELLVQGRLVEKDASGGLGGDALMQEATPGAAVRAALASGMGGVLAFNGGLLGREMYLMSQRLAGDTESKPIALPSHKLDIHMKSGMVFQIDADKHSFELLGELRGASDAVNIQKMRGLLENMNEHVIVDPYYDTFRPPAMFKRMRLPGPRVDHDPSPFPFYSRWAALMYRHLLRAT